MSVGWRSSTGTSVCFEFPGTRATHFPQVHTVFPSESTRQNGKEHSVLTTSELGLVHQTD